MDSERYCDSGAGTPDALERLWAPYRMSYIAEEISAREGAVVPDDAEGKRQADPFLTLPTLPDEDGLVVARGEHCFVCLNLYPYNPGHAMVIPYRQVAEYEELSSEEAVELTLLTQKLVKVIKRVSHPDAFNIGFNLGKGAGGSVSDHLHQHVVPRWIGDANFITIFGNTKVLPQTLRETRQLLADEWKAMEEES